MIKPTLPLLGLTEAEVVAAFSGAVGGWPLLGVCQPGGALPRQWRPRLSRHGLHGRPPLEETGPQGGHRE